ncbi:MAG TPA: M3 family metallopeptidase, partial [Coxiellaceae bacterium]|nr:M3 family metallopeptidase [Coxiellaceae bacterium]
AKLLGFNNYAERSLATKMANTTHEVLDFLKELTIASKPKAELDYQELKKFATEHLGMDKLNPWDIAYVTEKLRIHDYAISQEDLRAYFPEPQVLKGLFEIINRLFKLKVKKVINADVWNPAVQCYAFYDQQDKLISMFYLDLYAREHKRGGAWMDDCRIRRVLPDGSIQTPIAFITCNFNAPVGNEPALFYHDDVVTLFHEFGHALQHMLTTVNYAGVSGINGVPWDAVEFASQFFENWAWQKEGLTLIAQHYQTHEPLPNSLFEKMNKAKNFQAALHMIRQIKFALFDFRLFLEFDPSVQDQIQQIMSEVREHVDVLPTPEFNRFQHHFSHIFAGGYSAGYYSYKWAEVMASDAFSLFEENGIFDPHTSNAFLECILQTGGSEDPAVLFKRFRGREPDVKALLKQSGIL